MNFKKDLYIDNSLIGTFKGDTLLGDVYIEHNSFPEIDLDEIDTSVEFMGEKFSFPLIISAMIGGSERGLELNEILVSLAREFNIPIEIGSQQEFIEDEEQRKLFVSFMENDKEAFLISNLSANTNKEEIDKAMRDINAKAISIYLNSSQEAVKYDGSKNFRNVLQNISNISKDFSDKLIVKEKTSGMSQATVKKLVDAGVKYIDVSGFGGTNFIEMENLRNFRNDFSDLFSWGIPTAKSILNARAADKDVKIIASGGIKTGLDVAKSLVIGADYVGIAAELLKYLLHGGHNQAKEYLEDLIYNTKVVMFLVGAKNIEELKKVDFKLTGKLRELVE